MLQHEEIDPKILGQRLAEARKARGMTQEEVAEFLGYSRPTYIAIEKGDRPAKPDEVIKLAAYSAAMSTNWSGPASRSWTFSPSASRGRQDEGR